MEGYLRKRRRSCPYRVPIVRRTGESDYQPRAETGDRRSKPIMVQSRQGDKSVPVPIRSVDAAAALIRYLSASLSRNRAFFNGNRNHESIERWRPRADTTASRPLAGGVHSDGCGVARARVESDGRDDFRI